MKTAIKELLVPPFKLVQCGKIKEKQLKDNNRVTVFLLIKENCLDGKDRITNKFYTELQSWVADALNEKYERDFSEPLRWVKDSGYHYCPKCRTVFNDEKCKITPLFEHCPSCAQKLRPPEDVDG